MFYVKEDDELIYSKCKMPCTNWQHRGDGARSDGSVRSPAGRQRKQREHPCWKTLLLTNGSHRITTSHTSGQFDDQSSFVLVIIAFWG